MFSDKLSQTCAVTAPGRRRIGRFGQNNGHTLCPRVQLLHVPMSVNCPPELSPISGNCTNPSAVPFAAALRIVRRRCLPDGADFSWADQANNSSGEASSRKVAAKEAAKREIDNWFFMYFRIRIANYVSVAAALKQAAKDSGIFSEENFDMWTIKYKFKIRRSAPFKTALAAFTARLGLEGDPDVMFCTDGFFGDSFTGRFYNPSEVPNCRIMQSSTSISMGLRNGSSIFVSRCTETDRENAMHQLQRDLFRENLIGDHEEHDEDESEDTKDNESLGSNDSESILDMM